MSITVSWYDEDKTAILYVFHGPWTWEEYYAANEQASQLLDQIDYAVCMVVDLCDSPSIPRNVLSQGSRLFIEHPLIVCTIIIGINGLIRRLLELLMKMYPAALSGQMLHYVSTREEADEILAQMTMGDLLS